MIDFLNNKRVFVFDLETTGLPERVVGGKWGTASEYWPFNDNSKYDNSRIVSIAWSYIDKFNKYTAPDNQIHHYIRFPEDFYSIPTSHIHGITYTQANIEGVPFYDIFLQYGLYECLISTEYIIAHNINFDIHILLNELSRLNIPESIETIKHIQNIMSNNHCICSGEIGRNICKLTYKKKLSTTTKTSNIIKKYKTINYKMPKLMEFYKHLHGCEFDNAHNASGDVLALLKCLSKI